MSTPTINLGPPVDWAIDYHLPADIPAPIAPIRPSQQQPLGDTLGTVTGIPPSASVSTGTTASSSGHWWDNLFSTATNAALFGDTSKDSPLSRIVAIAIGLILIAAGVFMFKQTQTVIAAGTGVVKRGAELGATIAA